MRPRPSGSHPLSPSVGSLTGLLTSQSPPLTIRSRTTVTHPTGGQGHGEGGDGRRMGASLGDAFLSRPAGLTGCRFDLLVEIDPLSPVVETEAVVAFKESGRSVD